MPEFDKQKWVKEIIEEVARDYNILLSSDDPVLVTAILNQKLLSRFYDQQNEILDQFKISIEEQLATQNQNNQKLLASVSNKLIEKCAKQKNVSQPPTLSKLLIQFIAYIVIFVLGLLSGFYIV